MTDPTEAVRRPPGSGDVFELIVESARDFAIFTTDDAGHVTSWNSGAERLLGYPETDIVGRLSDLLFTPEDRAAGVPERERVTARGGKPAEDERWHLRRDGSRFWGSGLLMRLRGDVPGFVKMLRDRTEQHSVEEQLHASEERFRLLTVSIPQLVFLSRGDGNRTWGSPQWELFTGLSDADSRRFQWLDAVHPDDRALTVAAWQDAYVRGEYHVEHRILRVGDGVYRWHQTRARPLTGQQGPDADWVGTSADIHEQRTTQERQQVLVAELQHRTRNLLAVVQSIAGQTLRGRDSLEDFAAEFESRLRALGRVQSLLARTDSHYVDLADLVEAELAAHRSNDDGSGRVTVAGPPVLLPGDSAQTMALALHELATNAVKYGALRQAGGRLQLHWRLERPAQQPVVTLEWRETGVPISASPPRRRGYGSELIERALTYQLKARTELRFEPDGVRCVIAVPLQSTSMEEARG